MPANCFGRAHVDDMLEAHKRVQRETFSLSPGRDGKDVSNVAEYLRGLMRERFGVEGPSDGFFYFSAELGGLDLMLPFVSLLQIRDSVPRSSDGISESLAKSESEAYDSAKANFFYARNSSARKIQGAPPRTGQYALPRRKPLASFLSRSMSSTANHST